MILRPQSLSNMEQGRGKLVSVQDSKAEVDRGASAKVTLVWKSLSLKLVQTLI